jgi:hypothetical protein
MAFQYKLNKRFSEAIRYYFVRAYILNIDPPMLLEITDMMVDNINIL